MCSNAYLEADHLVLHLGRVHAGALTKAGEERFEQAVEREAAWIERFRRHTQAALAALPVLLLYGLLIVAAIEYDVNPGLAALPAPGAVGFAALIYYLSYTHERDGDAGSTGP